MCDSPLFMSRNALDRAALFDESLVASFVAATGADNEFVLSDAD